MPNMIVAPYIGATGFMTSDEAEMVCLNGIPPRAKRKFMLGVLACEDTISGTGNPRPSRYPENKKIGLIFPRDSFVLNTIHYWTRNKQTLDTQLQQIRSLVEKYWARVDHVDAWQFNMVWPPVERIGQALLPGERAILQLGPRALETLGDRLASLAEYASAGITDLLIDVSGGKGIPMDPEITIRRMEMIMEKAPQLQLGVAGSLTAETLKSRIRPLLDRFGSVFSIDTEHSVRDQPDDTMNIDAVCRYLAKSYTMLDR